MLYVREFVGSSLFQVGNFFMRLGLDSEDIVNEVYRLNMTFTPAVDYETGVLTYETSLLNDKSLETSTVSGGSAPTVLYNTETHIFSITDSELSASEVHEYNVTMKINPPAKATPVSTSMVEVTDNSLVHLWGNTVSMIGVMILMLLLGGVVGTLRGKGHVVYLVDDVQGIIVVLILTLIGTAIFDQFV